jgi:hypothetical protein
MLLVLHQEVIPRQLKRRVRRLKLKKNTRYHFSRGSVAVMYRHNKTRPFNKHPNPEFLRHGHFPVTNFTRNNPKCLWARLANPKESIAQIPLIVLARQDN